MKLVAYCRVSSVRQQEAFGPEVQRAAIRKWAKANGHRIVAWFEDTVSGTSELKDRAGWMQAEAAVKAGDARGIVVPRLDRLDALGEGLLPVLLEDGRDRGWATQNPSRT